MKQKGLLVLSAVLLAVLLTGCAGGKAPAAAVGVWQEPVRQAAEDCSLYALVWRYDPLAHTLQGRERIEYRHHGTPRETAVLNLYPNAYAREETAPFPAEARETVYPEGFSPGGMAVETVFVNGEPAKHTLSPDGLCLTVTLPEILRDGETAVLETAYTVQVPHCRGRFGYDEKTVRLTGCYPQMAVPEAEGFAPCVFGPIGDPYFGETAVYQVQIEAPSDYVFAVSGALVQSVPLEDGYTRLTVSAPAIRDFAAVGSPDFRVDTAASGQTEVRAYTLSGDGAAAAGIGAQALECFGSLFGAYPYEIYSLVQTDLFDAGMEYPNLSMIDGSLFAPGRAAELEEVIAHETAHQWWAMAVGSDPIREPWVDEALTTYSTLLYTGLWYGPEAEENAREQLRRAYRTAVSRDPAVLDHAVGEPVQRFENPQTYGTAVYTRGALMYVLLEQRMGREALLTALRRYAETYRFAVASGAELLSALGPEGTKWATPWLRGIDP